jgi:hypothetical protein
MIALFIDADACPVKQEIYRVAARHALKGTVLKVFVVTNSPITVPRDPSNIFAGALTASWPDLFRPSTSFFLVRHKTRMLATSGGMTVSPSPVRA